MQFTVQYCFHVICMYVPKCILVRHRQISGRFPMSHVDLGLFSEGGLRSHVDLGTIGLTGPRSQDDMGQNPRWYLLVARIGHRCPISALSHSKIGITPNKASPSAPIGTADAPPPGLSRMPRTAVRGAAVVEKCPPPRPRSAASGGAAPRPAEPWRRAPCFMYGEWAPEVFWTMKF